ncbi:hypothetical protein Ana3638_20800 [Anaerocolumna sedimenticola]|uniref:Methyltransferase domain-containing protein n=1 Tax=Anaerocolumna sedimenticola TaxID=2696063 RepID=A0A6P1TT72_9FIRM|nr:hypothetical protein [Anaerocolumna sedimenticola]QHQ62916.1 hypothetical protein Ana3638_20800 [Anaerocolumna sedimenticola]
MINKIDVGKRISFYIKTYAIWSEIEKLRPRMMLDITCGTGQGIKHQIKRINWPITIVMVDISHRI